MLKKTFRTLGIFILLLVWFLSGWPPIWQNPRIPPGTKEAKAASSGPNYASTAVDDAGTGTLTWTSPGNATATDNQKASVALTKNTGISHYIKATGFGFSIPQDAQIDGVVVEWEKSDSLDAGAGETRDNAVRIVKSDVIGATDKSNTNNWTTTDTFVSHGASTDLWGETWTAADINSSTFGAAISAKNVKISGGGAATTAYVDSVRITVYYTLPTYQQSAYRLFNNTNSTDVGTALAAQDTAATLGSTGAAFRLRILLHIGAAQLNASAQNFKLQFAQQSGTCDTGFVGETYSDVTAATVIAYNDNATPTDNSALTANANDPTHGADTIVSQTYEELNNFTNSVAAIPAAQDGKWDFSLKDNSATASTAYCLRAVKSDGTVLNTYSVIPQITTAVAAVVSVSVADGSVSYGTIAAGTSKDTTASGLNDTQTATNNGNVNENFNIKTSNATGGTQWTLGATPGTDVFVHEFSTNGGASWTALTTADSYQALATGIAASGTQNFDLRITVPSTSSDYQQKTITVTVQAVAQ